ncbi:UNVERIFIED_CONTAM: hypothetical protein PYX00_002470 [Menopon gallinae]|uniref:Takeout n=1 Tax=Menopon gallinae TaxID=328185 RepID=A0AAW2IIT5_9NEOP
MKVIVVLLLGFAAVTYARRLPSYIPICKQSDPDYSGCIKKAMTAVQPYLAKGIKELNIPALEPLVVPMVKLEQGTGAVNYRANLKDIKIYGLTKFSVDQLMVDFIGAKAFLARIDLPEITLLSDYEISGNVLVLPIQGNGEMSANLTNCKADIMLMVEPMQKKGKEYMHVKEVKTKLHFGEARANFDNLFNGNSVLGMTTNNFLNENAKDILNEIKPAIEAVTNMLGEDIINKIFKSAPANELFPQ